MVNRKESIKCPWSLSYKDFDLKTTKKIVGKEGPEVESFPMEVVNERVHDLEPLTKIHTHTQTKNERTNEKLKDKGSGTQRFWTVKIEVVTVIEVTRENGPSTFPENRLKDPR